MITGYAIILEDDILYCSNEYKYAEFEIILFIVKLLRSLNPKHSWRLSNILLKADTMERMIIKHFITEKNQNLFFCVTGDFKIDSQESRKMLEEFFEKIQAYYKKVDVLKHCSKKQVFREILKIITYYLWEKYAILFENEEIMQEIDNTVSNKIFYSGISSQGLPIISQLYDKTILKDLDKEITDENVELFNSTLSAQLATIEMNTLIRAQRDIKEIHFIDTEDKKQEKIILFEDIHNYSLNFFGTGNISKIKDVLTHLKKKISKEKILKKDFLGDLKSYKYLSRFFLDLESEF